MRGLSWIIPVSYTHLDVYKRQVPFYLSHICVFYFILITVFQVFTSHTPNKGIVAGTCSGMDRPFGRSDGLFLSLIHI